MRPLQKRLGRQSLSNAMPKSRQIVDSCTLLRPATAPARARVDRAATESALRVRADRQTDVQRHLFYDVQVDRRSQDPFYVFTAQRRDSSRN